MPKATTKAELIDSAKNDYNKLWEIVNLFTKEEQEQNFTYDADAQDGAFHWKRDKNIRDVLTHLHEWHQLVINWITSNEKGETKSFLPAGITWTNYQTMNLDFFQKHQSTSYEKAKQMFTGSHGEVMKIIERYGEKELFDKNAFKLGLKSSIADYCRAATTSHYNWALKKLKVYKKALGK